jgi:undecaprenyl pyrophosphate synthase
MAGNTPGPDTMLDDKLFRKIKEGVLNGNTLKKIAEDCGISELTLYDWNANNYLKLNDKITAWKREAMFNLGEKNLKDIMEIGIADKDSLKIVADISKYVTSTLGNKIYKTKNEQENSGSIDIKISKEVAEKYNDTTRNTSSNS